MFDYLEKINFRIKNRYETVIKNINNASNSFYDSFLDLLETFIKYILNEKSISYNSKKTCGQILNDEDNALILIENTNLKEIESIKYIIEHINKHKHHNEETVTIEDVKKYMNIFYQISSSYYTINIDENYVHKVFNNDFFDKHFGIILKEHEKLKAEVENMEIIIKKLADENRLSKKDLDAYKQLIEEQSNSIISLEEQNVKASDKLIKLQNIKLNSTEEKLDRTIELLLNTQSMIKENRICNLATAYMLGGKEIYDKWKKQAEEDIDKLTLENDKKMV